MLFRSHLPQRRRRAGQRGGGDTRRRRGPRADRAPAALARRGAARAARDLRGPARGRHDDGRPGNAGVLRRRRGPGWGDLLGHHLQVERRRRGRSLRAAGDAAGHRDPRRPEVPDAVAESARVNQFKDGIDFIFHSRESLTGGVRVGGSEIWSLMAKHLELSFAALALACLLAVPLGLWLGHIRKGQFLAISAANAGRAVPTLALIAFFIAYFGVGFTNVMLALMLLAIPPILTNAYVGVTQVDPDTVDAARGLGMTGFQIVRRVELPLALPLIFSGIRTSAVNVIATATIAPLAGVVTLGNPIINAQVYGDAGRLGASLVVAVLAVAADGGFGLIQRAVTPRALRLANRRMETT